MCQERLKDFSYIDDLTLTTHAPLPLPEAVGETVEAVNNRVLSYTLNLGRTPPWLGRTANF